MKKWKRIEDNCGLFGTLLKNVSETFDCLPYKRLIAKIDTNVFGMNS